MLSPLAGNSAQLNSMQAQRSSTSESEPLSPKGPVGQADLTMKIPLCAWHPKENTFAVAKQNSLFLYTQKRTSTSIDFIENSQMKRAPS